MSDRTARRIVDGKAVPAVEFSEMWVEGQYRCSGCGCNPFEKKVFRMRVKFGDADYHERFFLCGECMKEVADKMLELVKETK